MVSEGVIGSASELDIGPVGDDKAQPHVFPVVVGCGPEGEGEPGAAVFTFLDGEGYGLVDLGIEGVHADRGHHFINILDVLFVVIGVGLLVPVEVGE